MTWGLLVNGEWLDVSSVSVSRDAQSQLPAAVRDPAGATIGGGSIVVDVPLSPWLHETLIDNPFVLLWDGGSLMTGKVVEAQGSASSEEVSLEVIDVTGKMVGANYALPVVSEGSGDSQPGMHSQWVAEHILAQFGLSPYQQSRESTDPLTFVSAAGSVHPDGRVDRAMVLSGPAGGPTFSRGPWGLGVDDGNLSARLSVAAPVMATITMVMAIDWDDDPHLFIGWEDPFVGTSIDFEIDGTGGTPTWQATWTVGNIGGSESSPVESIIVGGSGYLTITTFIVQTGAPPQFSLAADIYWRGIQLVDNYNLDDNDHWQYPAPREVGLTVTSGPVSGISWHANDPIRPVEPIGDLGHFGAPCILSRPPDTPDTAWETIQQIAAASGGTIWAAGDGTIRAIGPADLTLAESTETLDGYSLDDVNWDEQIDRRVSQVEVAYTPIEEVVLGVGGILLQQMTESPYAPGLRRTFHIDLPGAATVDERRRRIDLYDGDDPNTDSVIGHAHVTATQISADHVKVQVDNTSTVGGWPYVMVWLAPGIPSYWTEGEDEVVVVDTGIEDHGTYTVPESVFRQDYITAAAMAAQVAVDLTDPPPEVSEVTVVDPGLMLDVGSIVTLNEPLETGAFTRRAMVVSAGWSGLGLLVVALRALRDSVGWVDDVLDDFTVGTVDAALVAETVGSVDADPATHFGDV